MRGEVLNVGLRFDEEDDNKLSLVFDEVISTGNICVVNTPSKIEFEYMYKHCTAVVFSVFTHWLKTPGIPGIHSITARRHTIIISRVDSLVFPWDSILSALSIALFAVYPDRMIFWELYDIKEKNIVKTVNEINTCNKSTQKIREEIAQESPVHLHLFDSLTLSA